MQNINLKDYVFMQNQSIDICNKLKQKLKPYFNNYVGQKVIIGDGSLIKKIKDDPEFNNIKDEKNYKVKALNNNDFVELNIYLYKII